MYTSLRPLRVAATLATAVTMMTTATVSAADLVEVLPLTDTILMVHIDDGHVEHHVKGHKRNQEKVVGSELDTAAADRPATYLISSADDPAYKQAQHPSKVARKSKGTDFAWLIEGWDKATNRAVNTSPDHSKEHWIYVTIPKPLLDGKTYTIDLGSLVDGQPLSLTYNHGESRSEAVHVNVMGYAPAAPKKYAYVYQWLGDGGSLDVKGLVGREFTLIDQATGKAAFMGKVAFRAPATQQETFHKSDSPPNGNFLNADVAECDFSDFDKPGRYVVAVNGVGCSFPFTVDADVYRESFKVTARGLYHNRSGIALESPYTEYTRPAPHNPKVTPGFEGKLVYTTSRFPDWTNGDHNKADVAAIEAGIKGPIESCGWYQDAGDWDSYWTHVNVATTLLLSYQLAPNNFTDSDLNIPESGNGIPDIIDEAAWLPRFCNSLRHELMDKGYGTGGIGLRVCGDHFGGDGEGVPSYEDVNRQYIASGEDPWSTYRYAGAAAQLAKVLADAGLKDPKGVDWKTEAIESYAWALANTRAGDDGKKTGVGEPLRDTRAYASAALWALTGDAAYFDQLRSDSAWIKADTQLWWAQPQGAYLALLSNQTWPDAELEKRLRGAVLTTADQAGIEVPNKRALRWGGNWTMPMLIGQQTTPWILEAAVGEVLVRPTDPAKADQYRASLYTTCDYFLGTNALNQTWVTGLGVRNPTNVFHMDSWYNGKGSFSPGLVPYGPWRKQNDLGQGPWDVDWPNKTVYPAIDSWPGNERWYNNRCSPLNSEFTVHQTTCYAAATFGLLCAPQATTVK